MFGPATKVPQIIAKKHAVLAVSCEEPCKSERCLMRTGVLYLPGVVEASNNSEAVTMPLYGLDNPSRP